MKKIKNVFHNLIKRDTSSLLHSNNPISMAYLTCRRLYDDAPELEDKHDKISYLQNIIKDGQHEEVLVHTNIIILLFTKYDKEFELQDLLQRVNDGTLTVKTIHREEGRYTIISGSIAGYKELYRRTPLEELKYGEVLPYITRVLYNSYSCLFQDLIDDNIIGKNNFIGSLGLEVRNNSIFDMDMSVLNMDSINDFIQKLKEKDIYNSKSKKSFNFEDILDLLTITITSSKLTLGEVSELSKFTDRISVKKCDSFTNQMKNDKEIYSVILDKDKSITGTLYDIGKQINKVSDQIYEQVKDTCNCLGDYLVYGRDIKVTATYTLKQLLKLINYIDTNNVSDRLKNVISKGSKYALDYDITNNYNYETMKKYLLPLYKKAEFEIPDEEE